MKMMFKAYIRMIYRGCLRITFLTQFLCWLKYSILEIQNVLLRLNFSSASNWNKLSNFKTASYCIFILLLIGFDCQLPPFVSQAFGKENAWQYVGDYEGVNLYRSLNETEGRLPFKAIAELDVAYQKIVMALVDAERKANWAPKLKSTAIHSQFSPNRFEYSEYYQTPWPFKDREFLLEGTVKYLQDRVLFTAVSSKNKQLARDDHLVANIQTLTFAVIPLTRDKTRVEFTFSGDLGGWIPAFVKNIIQKKWPVRFIQSLKKYVANNDALVTDRYRHLKKKHLL